MHIQYFASEDWEKPYVSERLGTNEITFHDGPIGGFPDVKDGTAEALCIFIDSKIGAAEMDRFPALKLIATRSTGFDHIDLAAARARGITVSSVPSYGENTVAEFAFALLLALAHRIPEAQAAVKAGGFSPQGLRGFDLQGKTLGVVGCGHIGIHMIRMAHGFGMKVLAFDIRQDEAIAREHRFAYATLDDLLAQSDVISLHVPYNPHTHHLVNSGNVGKIKRGAYLINTSRGAVVETAALVKALKDGTLAGAGLDVLEEEGDMADEAALLTEPHPNEDEVRTALANHYIIDHPRVIVTPHTAFNTTEAITRILDTTIENMRHFAAGAPMNIVSAA